MTTTQRVAIVLASAALAALIGTGRAHASPFDAPQPPPGAAQPSTPSRGGASNRASTASSESNEIVQLVDQALAGIDLRTDQIDALQKLGAKVDSTVGALDEAKRSFLLALASQIEAGDVDTDALEPQMLKVVEAATVASPIVRSALERLHSILDPSQRKQFVANFRNLLRERSDLFDPKARVDEWARVLDLTDDQRNEMLAIVQEDQVANDVARARVDLVLAAFPGDTFSMADLLPENTIGERTDRMLTRVADVAHRVTQILTPAQRAIAAKTIRDEASSDEGAGPTTGAPQGGSTGGSSASPSSPEPTGTTSQPLWAGGRSVVRYRRSVSYGFSAGYGAGYGGFYLL